MINFNFVPSWRLARYTVWLYISRSLAVLLSLSIVLMMLNLLSESGKILAVPGNGEAELWRYVGYRFPQLLSFAFPFSFSLIRLNDSWRRIMSCSAFLPRSTVLCLRSFSSDCRASNSSMGGMASVGLLTRDERIGGGVW